MLWLLVIAYNHYFIKYYRCFIGFYILSEHYKVSAFFTIDHNDPKLPKFMEIKKSRFWSWQRLSHLSPCARQKHWRTWAKGAARTPISGGVHTSGRQHDRSRIPHPRRAQKSLGLSQKCQDFLLLPLLFLTTSNHIELWKAYFLTELPSHRNLYSLT